jgi:response regulator RpfG family c-di-GMP phosphodiesterase
MISPPKSDHDSRSQWTSDVTPLINWPDCKLLIVDDELAHGKVLTIMLEQSGIVCKAVPSAAAALEVLKTEPMDAVIADLNMPGISGMELLTQIRLHYSHLVFLMATGIDDVRLGVQAMRQGADDYLIKPLHVDSVLLSLDRAFHKKRLENDLVDYRQNLEAMVSKRTEELQGALGKVEQSYTDTLDALGAAIDLRDEQTAGHSRRVCLCSINILARMRGSLSELKSLAMGAWLHDIGKLAIPDAILFKPGPLTRDERKIIEGHVRIGFDLVKRIPFLNEASEIILSHHERWDGSGYPRGLKTTEIPLSARIFAVADTLDAMTSDRPYRSARSFQDARDEIGRMSGILFDSRVVEIFLDIPDISWEVIREQTSTMQISAVLEGIGLQHQGDPAELVSPFMGVNE